MSEAAVRAADQQVSDEQVETFNRQGWIVIRQFFSPDEQKRLLPALHDYVASIRSVESHQDAVPFGPTEAQPSSQTGITGQYAEDSNKTAFNLATAPPEAVRIIKSPRLGGTAARLLRVNAIRVMHFSGLFKPGGSAGTPLHQDLSYLPLDGDRLLTIWIPLSDIEATMAPLIFASGSHTAGSLEDPYSVRGRFPFVQTGPMKAGDISVHAGWTVHGSLKNSSTRQREAFGIAYYGDGARIRHGGPKFTEVLLGTCFEGLNPGDLAFGPMNPIVFPAANDL